MMDDDFLAAELAEFAPKEKARTYSVEERRIVTGFEDIVGFVEMHGRLPIDEVGNDIFERMYAVRLEALRRNKVAREVLKEIDHLELLDASKVWSTTKVDGFSDDELAAELGEFATNDLTELRHVRSSAERRAAEEIANREPCEDFERFEGLFEQIQKELKTGLRRTVPYEEDATVEQGNLFIVGGVLAYVAEKGEEFLPAYGKTDARLRVVFANRTESNLLMRSLQRALQRDDASRRVTKPDDGPLFSGEWELGDKTSGTIYVLRSQSDHPYVSEHRSLIHKIGVTGGDVARRVANAANEATYLLADVDIVATYELVNIQRTALERILHRVLAPARLDMTIPDRFGKEVRPREWFLVPFQVIEEVIERIQDGSITNYVYDPKKASLVRED